jgi:hypothetical protein
MRRLVMGLAVLAALLAGCTAAPSTPRSPDAHEGTGGASPTTNLAVPVAVVTIASVDVDGLNLTVAGFVTQVEESGGTCEFTLISEVSGAEVVRMTEGLANVDTTSCGTVQIPLTELSKGAWNATLAYSSSDVELTSSVAERVEIP